MTTEWLGGGFMIALAAVLWLVYLVPSWFRSRQYQATERNAVRLQQTLRILAETAEVPHEVRVEANARSIAEQERVLKHRAVVREIEAVPAAVRTADRIRRSRAVTALVFAISLVVAVLGGVQAASTGTWIILAGGLIASAISLTMLVKLAKAGRRLRLPRPEGLRAPAFVDHGDAFESVHEESAEIDDVELEQDAADTSWVPVAVPRPAYLARSTSAPLGLVDAVDADADAGTATVTAPDPDAAAHHESLRRAAAQAEAALRERLRLEHETVPELPAPAPAPSTAPVEERPVPSRFARMGIVDGDTAPHLDLDAVLARRRAG